MGTKPAGYVVIDEGRIYAKEKLRNTSKFAEQKIIWNNNTIPNVVAKEDGSVEYPVVIPTTPVYTLDKFLQFEKNCKIEAVFNIYNIKTGVWETDKSSSNSLKYYYLVSLDD